MAKLRFKIRLYDSTHWIHVLLHSTRAVYRQQTSVKGHVSKGTEACCWQSKQPSKDGLVAEIHMAAENLCYDTIIHECTHAAFHRAVLLGIPFTDDGFQESVATDAGQIADGCIKYLHSQKIKILCLK